MRQFFFNGDEDPKSKNEFDFADTDDVEIIQAQVNLVAVDLNQKLMELALRVCEKSFWWRWYSADKKIEVLTKVYGAIEEMTAIGIEIDFTGIIDEDLEDFDDLDDLDDDDDDEDE
jgi:hypothetical protein